MNKQESNTDKQSGRQETASTSNNESITNLFDVLLVILERRKLVARTTLGITFLALSLALFSAAEYTSTARVIRESPRESTNALSGGLSTLRGFGFNLGGSTEGLSNETYPDIIKSREVRLEMAHYNYYFPAIADSLTLVEYYSREHGLGKRLL